MAFEQFTRNRLQKFVAEARALLTEEFTRQMQNDYGLNPHNGAIDALDKLRNLDDAKRETARILRETVEHYASVTPQAKTADLLDRIVREQAFTVLNRLAALRMAEARGFLIESLARGYSSKGFRLYQRVAGTGLGETGDVYRTYLFSLFDEFSLDLKVLFDRFTPFGRLFPREKALLDLLELINHHEIEPLWAEDETIGWIYQYFNSKDERKKMRDESAAPRNSRELAVRNQFFTPRYVVEFLTDNTLGRTWYEMTRGATSLGEKCRYLARRPPEIFLNEGENAPEQSSAASENLAPEELLAQPVYIPHRTPKDPREILLLDPACGSMHFGLYAFDLFLTIYEEAWQLEETKGAGVFRRSSPFKSLRETYENDRERFLRDVPRLVIEHNIHGVDIDPRAVQIAGLSLWLRAQRAWAEQNVQPLERPVIQRSNIVTAEPMPGEEELFHEFLNTLPPDIPKNLIETVFERMKLAGEAGSLLRIEDEIREPIAESKRKWIEYQDKSGERENAPQPVLFEKHVEPEIIQPKFIFEDVTDESFWQRIEKKIFDTLEKYAGIAAESRNYQRRLFAKDALEGFGFIDLCRKKYDVVVMNPPFGDASLPSKPYVDETYGDTKGDVYKAFVECFQDRLVPAGMLGIISSRTGFFLSGSADWRERVVLRLYRPLLLADFGMGVLDAMVETAAYVLRSLTEKEDRELTLQLLPELERIPTDKNDIFSTKKYQDARGLKRFQANAELNRLQSADFIKYVEGSFPRWSPLRGVIAKAPIPPTSPFPPLVCFRLLGENDKGKAFNEIFANENDSRRFIANPISFNKVPNAPFCYWVSSRVHEVFETQPSFQNNERFVRQGVATADDFRFVRAWWEVASDTICSPHSHDVNSKGAYCVAGKFRWFLFAKGGSFSPFFANLYVTVNWQNDGLEIRDFINPLTGKTYSRPQNTNFFFRAGITWSARPHKRGAFSHVPNGSTFSHTGTMLFLPRKSHWATCALLNSNAYIGLLHLLMPRGGVDTGQTLKYELGYVSAVPIPNFDGESNEKLNEFAIKSFEITKFKNSSNEISHVFHLPALLQIDAAHDLGKSVEAWQRRVDEAEEKLREYQREIDDIAFRLYGILDEDRAAIENTAQPAVNSENQAEDAEEEESESLTVERKPLTADLIAYLLGAAFGRWDARLATGERSAPELPDPFAPLPVCSPGMLQNAEGLPAAPEDVPADYPLEIVWNGILVDDAGNRNDIENRLRDVLHVIRKERAEAIETEAGEILGVRSLREYFRKPAGFFADHLKRYSKSRRQAPIYLPLATRSGEYTLWLYYHRLTDQTLYTCVLDYVEPKLKSVADEFGTLRVKPARTKEEEKRFENLQNFANELEEMRDELLRLAPVWKPNLNDGVQITVAPLWKLFRFQKWRKTLEETWKKLEKGDYDWAHLAESFFPERVREKCGKDKSLAIAHDLEDLYVEPPPKPGKRQGGKPKENLTENRELFNEAR